MADKKVVEKKVAEKKDKKPKASKVTKKIKKSVHKGRIYMHTSYNNTILTFTDDQGHVLAWSSSGVVGFKGSRKSTPYAGQRAAEDLNNKITKFNVQEVDVYIKGAGAAKQLALRELGNGGYRVLTIIDNNGIRMGGTLPRKKPRK
jgi:small subunit ribosomal protein S11